MKNKKFEMTASRRVRLALVLSAITILATGCGQEAYREGDDELNNLGGGSTTDVPNFAGGIVNSANGVITVGDPLANLESQYSWHVKMTGSGTAVDMSAAPMRIIVDNKVKVRITAGDGLKLPNSGYTIGFNCEKFSVTIGNVTKTAFVKKANYTSVPLQYGWMSFDPCASAGTSWTGDFSAAFSPGGGEEERPVVIKDAQYDNCHASQTSYFYGTYYGGCQMSGVHYTHPIDANVEVFVDSY